MLETALGALAWLGRFSEPLSWVVLGAFVSGALLERRSRAAGRYALAGAWVLFAVFWFTLVHHFAFEQKSIIEGIGTAVAVPASLYVAYLLYDGRDTLFVLSRAVAVMGVVYMPFEAVLVLREWLVETVAAQTQFLMALLGHEAELVTWAEAAERIAAHFEYGPERTTDLVEQRRPYLSTFYFTAADGHPITYTILIACTGIGSMAIFAGLIAAVRAPLRRKLRAFAASVPVIYALNLVRNVFIGLSFGNQWMQLFPEATLALFGSSDPYMVSYFWADRILAQSLSVLALVAITYLVVRELPEVLVVVEDLLFVVTGTEYDLEAALDVPERAPDPEPAVRADGGDRD